MKTPNAKEQPGLSRREMCVCRRWRAPGGFFQVEGRTDRSPAGVSAQHPSGVEEGGRVWKQAASQVSGSGSWISGLASTGLNRRAHRRGSGDHGDGWIRGRAGGRGECSGERKPGPGPGVHLGCWGVRTPRRGVSSECAARARDRLKAGTSRPFLNVSRPRPREILEPVFPGA